jgi:predicted PhzF superfamily epimerase YddE/YHI9
MDFPAWPPAQIDAPAGIADALGTPVEWTGRSGNDYLLALVADERAVRELSPDMAGIAHDALFWWSLGVSLVIAFLAAFPVNRWLISRGRGHAAVHGLQAH